MAAVERILATATSSRVAADGGTEGQAVATHALWICACVTVDDSPTWLIYDRVDGDLAWLRVPDGIEPLDLVDARRSAGGHADPAEVLRWLIGDALDPWSGGGYGDGDASVLDELLQKIRHPD